MSSASHTERAFEDRVEHELLEQEWEKAQGGYRAERGLDTGELLRFIGATQQKKWDKLIDLYGGDQPTAQRQFAQRLASEIDARGVLDVLRQGVKDKGVAIDLAYFRPGHTLDADALHDYHAVAQQPHDSARDARDLADTGSARRTGPRALPAARETRASARTSACAPQSSPDAAAPEAGQGNDHSGRGTTRGRGGCTTIRGRP